MAKYRNALPQLADQLFITDGGLETTLVFLDGIELPEFAAFVLLGELEGQHRLETYFLDYIHLAHRQGVGFIYESPTWRASSDWAKKLHLSEQQTAELNRRAIDLGVALRSQFREEETPIVISGCIGPRGDGYSIANQMTAEEAAVYHAKQIDTLYQSEADMVAAYTINYVEEAIGITQAAQDYGIPVVISFTVETDGRLPSGQSLRSAIEMVDEATASGPVYYMINCAHPTHFTHVLEPESEWTKRIKGIRANASCKSHAELDEATELDAGDPKEFGALYNDMRTRFPHITILGGCCGTDHRHVKAICDHCM